MIRPADPAVLCVHQHVRASRERVFDAWTDPTSIVHWWGPPGVTCTLAEVDLREGGQFRLANKMPDGSIVWIVGVYEHVDRPRRLVHSWTVGSKATHPPERVTIDFTEREAGTDITITHTGVTTSEMRAGHEAGWLGCAAGIAAHLEERRSRIEPHGANTE